MSATKQADIPSRVQELSSFRPSPSLAAAWSDNRLLVITSVVFVAGVFVARGVVGLPFFTGQVLHLASFQNLFLFLLLPLPFAFLIGRLQVKDPAGRFLPGLTGWKIAGDRFVGRFFNPRSLARALIAGLAITLLLNTYASWKGILSAARPFSWDEPFARLDRAVHFGNDPWALLQPLLGRGWMTLWLDNLYYTWLPFVFAAMGFLVWTHRSDLRLRGLVGIAFVWIGLGTIAATVFSSAGPAFYGYLVGSPNPFQPLVDYLQQTRQQFDLFAPRLQETMWAQNQSGKVEMYLGISAMPSVHVAMPTLLAFIGWERNRWLGVLFAAYTGLIVIATIHLGWHYAIDGYASILAVWLYWRWSVRLVKPDSPDGSNNPGQRPA